MINIAKIMAGTECRKQTTFPFTAEKIFLRVLSEHDLHEAAQATDAHYRDRSIGFANMDERNAYKAEQELFRSIVDENGERAFPDFQTFAKAITPEIARRLLEEQNSLQNEVNPSIEDMTQKEFDEIIGAIKKKSEVVSTITDSRILRKLLLHLVSQQSKQPADK